MFKKNGYQLRATLNSRVHDFVDFVVRHWEAVIADKFAWMTKSPTRRCHLCTS
jgi:hypothetical protein